MNAAQKAYEIIWGRIGLIIQAVERDRLALQNRFADEWNNINKSDNQDPSLANEKGQGELVEESAPSLWIKYREDCETILETALDEKNTPTVENILTKIYHQLLDPFFDEVQRMIDGNSNDICSTDAYQRLATQMTRLRTNVGQRKPKTTKDIPWEKIHREWKPKMKWEEISKRLHEETGLKYEPSTLRSYYCKLKKANNL